MINGISQSKAICQPKSMGIGLLDSQSKSIPTFNLFETEPWLLDVAKKAINNFHIPWHCDDALIAETKKEAIRCLAAGVRSKSFLNELVPKVFKTKRDATHGIAKITSCGHEAINLYRLAEIGEKRFVWRYCELLCDFPEHSKLDGKEFSLNKGHKGEFPSSRYGCRCRGSIRMPT
ncbi:hypothetical protein DU000_02430 [Parvibium lacunae]|uniref:Phage head morphogenesis domain-containing protein n=2 Tax=Parvibium lacunae TaxID=1888893 RepID=A0A368L7F4_9BURK|nr:hypothetical protein DU000_02430 [Parvibium lacunae]